jgi:succinoglycan biosynthesis transport protein ExoP
LSGPDDLGFSDDAAPVAAPPAETFDWRRWVGAVWRRWWLVLLTVVVSVVVISAVTVRQPKQYKATVSMIIDARSAQVLTGVTDVYDASAGATQAAFFMTEFEVMRSRAVARATAERLGLALDDAHNGLAAITDQAERSKRIQALDPADLVIDRYTIEPAKGTNVVRISVIDGDPAFAARFANAVAESYLDVNIDKRVDGTKDASDWLLVQNEELRRKVRGSEDALQQFMVDNGVLNASLDSQLEEVKQRQSAFNAQLAMEEASQIRDVLNVKALEQVRADPALLDTLPEVQSATVVAAIKQRLIELRTLEMELGARYLPDHPKVKLLSDQKSALEADLKREVDALLTSMDRQNASREATINGLRQALDVERAKEARLNNLALDYGRLRRERDTDQKLFDMVAARLKEADITGAQPFNNAHILDRALPPKTPFKPNLQQALLIALVLGLALGVAAALLLELGDTTVKSQLDLEALVDVPFLGLLPVIPVEDAANATDRATRQRLTRERDLYIVHNPRSAVAECARFVRTNLMFMSPDRPLRTLVVTSPAPQEGKSTTAVLMAIAMAQAGSRTLIVDTDMRKPRLHRVFDVASDVGVSAVLLGESTVEQAVQATEVPNLSVLVCGALPPNPAEILLSTRFADLVKELGSKYDRVIFDTPPVGPVTDPAILGTLVDGVVLITKCGQTSKESVKLAMRALRDANVRIFGAILNDVDVTARRYAGAYYAYYRKYGGYYGDDAGDKNDTDKAAQ